MCGLAGFFKPGGCSTAEARAIATSMVEKIVHRGPDHRGVWVEADTGIAMAHQRLSILDLSSAGNQPMLSPNGRYVLVYNGEIYNYRSLRAELDKVDCHAWKGHSDTETLLAGFDAWGIEHTINRCVGMFAFVVWDHKERSLTLGRDRLGEKPLYYGWQRGSFLFASELKSIKAYTGFSAEVDRDALSLFMRYSYIPAPRTIYQGICKLPPGSLLTVSSDCRESKPVSYWSVMKAAEDGLRCPFEGDFIEATDELERLLKDAIGQQLVADVPLGAFLSGGVDSSVVVALMQKMSHRPVRTFSIGFYEDQYNEAGRAKEVAEHINTDHKELYVTSEETMSIIPQLSTLYDEPFADISQIPTFLVSRMASQDVTVSLSGDGGDEVFGGYNRYLITDRLWSRLSRFPVRLRRIIANIIISVSPETWDRLTLPLLAVRPGSKGVVHLGDKLHKGARVVISRSLNELYQSIMTYWPSPASLVLGSQEPASLALASLSKGMSDNVERMMLLDSEGYLADDILVKIDRAAMGVSLETRVPMLDHRVVEFAWRLPKDFKLYNGVGKRVLRQVLYRHVPRRLIERPKMGFSVPASSWLRGPLRDWVEDLLNEKRLESEGYLHPGMVRCRWKEHLSGKRNWQGALWNVLMFESWLNRQ